VTRGFLLLALCAAVGLASCGNPGDETTASGRPEDRQLVDGDPVDPRCAWPASPRTIRQEGNAVLLEWRFPETAVYSEPAIPSDGAYLAFRAAVRADGAVVRRPIADPPQPANEAEAALWRDEDANHELAQSGTVGHIEGITCLDALLFAYQNARVPELTNPTEFLASVLRREAPGRSELAVVFGAGHEMFVPKSMYGLDVVTELVDQGWEYWYTIHNHTLQRNGDRVALGRPALSVSDVQVLRSLAAEQGLKSARVTNGFYTFSAQADELSALRSR